MLDNIDPETAGWVHPTADEIAAYLGSSNWVHAARRSPRLVERYGADVVVITPQRYQRMKREIIARRPHCPHCGQLWPFAASLRRRRKLLP